MEQILSNLKLLDPDELRVEILKAGLKCGPITSTTRCIFEKKLARTLLEQQGVDVETFRSNDNPQNDSHGLQAKYSEDRDFGYNVGLNPPIEETISRRDFAANGGLEAAHISTPLHSDYPPVFYAVCPVYDDASARNEKTHIYTDKKEALQVVKMLKGSRFKAFQAREDAEKFATGICDYYPSPNKSSMSLSPVKLSSGLLRDGLSAPDVESLNKEKANSFKSPRTQDLTAKLRKAVEKGDLATFSDLIWSNPRYLIGSGDNPTVVQEGCRYNVMHVAAKENQAGICQLLLDTLENPEFMRLMYPDDDDEVMLQKRIRYLVDLYLNTPDKMGFDTPLHFACKFGNPDVVNVLCSHPDIIKNPRNKYDQTPEQVICERNKNKSPEFKEKIREYLKGHCYVPLLRAEDNSSFPVIGVPWSPEQPDILSQPRYFGSPKDPLLTVRAFAGPMSPSKADDFRRIWKTPPRDRAGFFHNVRKTDPERGEERVGRELAHELDVPWVEHWEFLGCFVDLSSQDGVGKLEEYLGKREASEQMHLEHDHEMCNKYKTPSPAGKGKKICNSVSVGAFLDDEDDMSLEEIKNRQNAALRNSLPLTSTETITIPECIMDATPLQSSCHSDGSKRGCCSPLNDKVIPPGERRRQQCLEEALLSPVSNLMAEFEKLTLSGLNEASNVESPSNNGCAMSQRLSEMTVSDTVDLDSSSPSTRTTSSELMQIDHHVPSFSHLDHPLFPGTSNEALSNSHSGSPSQQLIMKTPTKHQSDRFLFLLGKEPTKLDSDVLLAIENVEIDAQKFPNVSRWMKSVLFYSSTERQSWPSPAVASGKYRSHMFGCNSPGGNGFSTPGRSSPILGSPGKYMNTSDYCSPGRYSPAYASHIQLLRLRHFSDHSGL
ncbi:ankyrin repeat and LEM domain-containing protein 2 isoform X2 [Hyla sarda]|nr:ankyrin repeat and LEM domain-containing protein 2 isoform X2 [Hyla sarda]XP_056388804.1 ankyrin repeat and LEM domain-containing protein 2 isoform X2 [Hyla sarda]XP_056388809.1 ankyrin repeat and LEM domain-containing protein 2 isoform X2 [Hyla sarda]XP_056388816.1 ankyrin repeat and LEM domain-containing protein 2 isoform X2 [Hyla sarda]